MMWKCLNRRINVRKVWSRTYFGVWVRASSHFAAELRLGLEIDRCGPLRETNEDGLKFWMFAVKTDTKTDCERCCVLVPCFFFVFVRLRPRCAVERSAEHGRRNETSRKRVTPLWTLPGQVAMNHTVYCSKSCFLGGGLGRLSWTMATVFVYVRACAGQPSIKSN